MMFSIYHGGASTDSFIDFGAPNASIVSDYSSTTFVTTSATSDRWASQVKGFRWGTGETDPAE